jgi:hypothetical protein
MKRYRDVVRGNECNNIRDNDPAADAENLDSDQRVQDFLLKSNKHEHKHSKQINRHD